MTSLHYVILATLFDLLDAIPSNFDRSVCNDTIQYVILAMHLDLFVSGPSSCDRSVCKKTQCNALLVA